MTTTNHHLPAANLAALILSNRTQCTVHRIQCPSIKICPMHSTDCRKKSHIWSFRAAHWGLSMFSFFHLSIHGIQFTSPSLESAASSTWGSSYWYRPHAPLASSEQPNFLSIYATVMTPLISNSPAAMEAHLWCMQWQQLISSVGAAESLSGLAKWAS